MKELEARVKLTVVIKLIEQVVAGLTTADLSKPDQDRGMKLDILHEFMKPSVDQEFLLRVSGELKVVQGNLGYTINDDNGEWIWEIDSVCFSVDDIDWIDPDWGIIKLIRRYQG